jgi:pimeloyl-ACP methyl ester carboxylesterase
MTTTYALIHGAGDTGWYWHLVAARLRDRGNEAVAMDLPCEDDSAGLAEYADTVVDAVGNAPDLVVVVQSFGGFTAPLVCERMPVAQLVLVAAGMIPSPGETPGDWWENTGYEEATKNRADVEEYATLEEETIATYLHDVPSDLAAEALRRGRGQSGTPMVKPWPLASLPGVSTRFLLCRDDRFFPADFMRCVVSDRLGIVPDEIDGSHCIALSRPKEVADRLVVYRTEL